MSALFQELDWRETPWGAISLRRRRDPVTHGDIYEIKLDDDFLMSSLFTVAEIEVARRALAALPGDDLDVVVGGLGLGYTALTVLDSPRVRSVIVVEALAEVIEWHRRGLIPAGERLTSDPRCRLVCGDFFALIASDGPDPEAPGRRFHSIIVDIDHSPRHLLHPSHAGFYEADGVRRLAGHVRPGGVFALWSNDPPDGGYLDVLGGVFATAGAEVVGFDGADRDHPGTNTVYLATAGGTDTAA